VQKLAKRDYIHTWGYSSRSKLCGLSLNSSEGRNSVADLKTFANSSEEALTHREVEEHFILVFKNSISWGGKIGTSSPTDSQSVGVSVPDLR